MTSNGKLYREFMTPVPTMGRERTIALETRHRPQQRSRASNHSPQGPAPYPPECGVMPGASLSTPWHPHPPGLGQRRETGRPTVGATAGDHRCAVAQPMTRLAIALAFLLVATPAWGQTPTLVQHYYTGTNSPVRGLTATNYAFRLPNKTLSGNCLIMFLDYPHGVPVSSITDDGNNTWPAAAVTADGSVGSAATAAYVLPNGASGTRTITVTFSAAV